MSRRCMKDEYDFSKAPRGKFFRGKDAIAGVAGAS